MTIEDRLSALCGNLRMVSVVIYPADKAKQQGVAPITVHVGRHIAGRGYTLEQAVSEAERRMEVAA